MSGYNCVFEGMFKGSLCGRWPEAPVFATLLAFADKNGEIDYTPEAISVLTGWPMAILLEAIEKLTQPDPKSRFKGHQGRRLVATDPVRGWGWKVAAHEYYREKARKMGSDARRAADGSNAQRMRKRRVSEEVLGEVSNSRDSLRNATRVDPPSEAEADTYAEAQGKGKRSTPNKVEVSHAKPSLPPLEVKPNREKDLFGEKPKTKPARRCPADWVPSLEFQAWFKAEGYRFDLAKEVEAMKDCEFRVAHSDWNATARKWMRTKAERLGRNSNGGTYRPGPRPPQLQKF
jgi:hypothetical protein